MINTLLGIQIIAISFAIFMLYIATIDYKKSHIEKREYVFWVIAWSLFSLFTLFPRVLDPLLTKIFVTRAMDLLMIIAFMILSYLGYANHIGIKDAQRKIAKMVSKQAKKNAKIV